MKLSVGLPSFLYVALFLIQPALASPRRPGPRPGRSSGVTYETCFTTMASTSTKKVPTVSRTFTGEYTVTRIRKITPRATSTPDAVTSTVTTETVVSTTAESTQKTNTASSTITSTSSSTITTTTSTVISTVRMKSTTTSTTTSTVPAPAGFTGILDTLPGSASLKQLSQDSKAKSPLKNNSPLIDGPDDTRARYPSIVRCNVFSMTATFITSTTTLSTTITETAATPTVLATDSTTTTTTTTVALPDAETTTTTTTSTTTTDVYTPITTSTTTLYTETVTEVIPAATPYYAMCARNGATRINGGYFQSGYAQVYQTDHSLVYPFATTVVQDIQQCCQVCAANHLSEFCYLYQANLTTFRCQVIYSSSERTCPPQNSHVQVQKTSTNSGIGFVNGYCGRVDAVI